LSFPSGRTAEELVVDDAAGLAWIVNLGCIELHPHPVRSADLNHPDELRVDLDPGRACLG
jgi:DNA primase